MAACSSHAHVGTHELANPFCTLDSMDSMGQRLRSSDCCAETAGDIVCTTGGRALFDAAVTDAAVTDAAATDAAAADAAATDAVAAGKATACTQVVSLITSVCAILRGSLEPPTCAVGRCNTPLPYPNAALGKIVQVQTDSGCVRGTIDFVSTSDVHITLAEGLRIVVPRAFLDQPSGGFAESEEDAHATVPRPDSAPVGHTNLLTTCAAGDKHNQQCGPAHDVVVSEVVVSDGSVSDSVCVSGDDVFAATRRCIPAAVDLDCRAGRSTVCMASSVSGGSDHASGNGGYMSDDGDDFNIAFGRRGEADDDQEDGRLSLLCGEELQVTSMMQEHTTGRIHHRRTQSVFRFAGFYEDDDYDEGDDDDVFIDDDSVPAGFADHDEHAMSLHARGDTGAFARGDTGAFAQQDTGAFAQQDTGAFAQQDTGAFAQRDAGGVAQRDNDAFARQDTGAFAQQDTGAFAPADACAFAPADTGAFAQKDAGGVAQRDNGAVADGGTSAFAQRDAQPDVALACSGGLAPTRNTFRSTMGRIDVEQVMVYAYDFSVCKFKWLLLMSQMLQSCACAPALSNKSVHRHIFRLRLRGCVNEDYMGRFIGSPGATGPHSKVLKVFHQRCAGVVRDAAAVCLAADGATCTGALSTARAVVESATATGLYDSGTSLRAKAVRLMDAKGNDADGLAAVVPCLLLRAFLCAKKKSLNADAQLTLRVLDELVGTNAAACLPECEPITEGTFDKTSAFRINADAVPQGTERLLRLLWAASATGSLGAGAARAIQHVSACHGFLPLPKLVAHSKRKASGNNASDADAEEVGRCLDRLVDAARKEPLACTKKICIHVQAKSARGREEEEQEDGSAPTDATGFFAMTESNWVRLCAKVHNAAFLQEVILVVQPCGVRAQFLSIKMARYDIRIASASEAASNGLGAASKAAKAVASSPARNPTAVAKARRRRGCFGDHRCNTIDKRQRLRRNSSDRVDTVWAYAVAAPAPVAAVRVTPVSIASTPLTTSAAATAAVWFDESVW